MVNDNQFERPMRQVQDREKGDPDNADAWRDLAQAKMMAGDVSSIYDFIEYFRADGMLPPKGKHWQYTPTMLGGLDAKGEIYWSKNGNPRRKEAKHSTLSDIAKRAVGPAIKVASLAMLAKVVL